MISKRILGTVAILALVSAFYFGGLFAPIDRAARDMIFKLVPTSASGTVVLVEIDAPSLHKLDSWPWPRSYHARLVERLNTAGAARIALDIDFSSVSSPREDRALADALRDSNASIILPTFKSRTLNSSGTPEAGIVEPIEPLRRHAMLGSVSVALDDDGRVRRFAAGLGRGETPLPSIAVRLAGRDVRSLPGTFSIDFGIDVATVPRLSYADVLDGKFDPDMVRGKNVIVGATSIELGDRLPAPVLGVITGPMLQVLAYETVVQGRMLHRASPWITFLLALVLSLVLGRAFEKASPRQGALIGTATILGLFAGASAAQIWAPAMLDIAAWWAVTVVSYLVHLIIKIDQQTLQLFFQRFETVRRRAMLNSVVEDSFDGIVITDETGVIQLFNPAAGRMLSVFPADALGKPIGEVVPRFAPIIHANLESCDGTPFELDIPRGGDGSFTAEIVVTVSREQPGGKRPGQEIPNPTVVILTFRDVTARKQVEQAERRAKDEAVAANRAKSEFLANMGHELRTPLNAIIGFSEMMAGEYFGPMGQPRYLDYANEIQYSGNRLLRVINDVLDMSKIEVGEMKLVEEDIDTAETVKSCIALITQRVAAASLTLTTEIAPDTPWIHADSRMLKQTVNNLLSNAVKFTPEGGWIKVSARATDDGGLALTVADSGIGMVPEQLERALAPFGQADTGLQRKYEGVGLGLPLARAMTELHGGRLQVESAPDKGTTVTVLFGRDRIVPPGGTGGQKVSAAV